MNEITFEEELAQLEALRQKHQLNAEEIMDWEEKVYDLQQEIRERDAESLDQLSDSVIDALENRYQAMLDGENRPAGAEPRGVADVAGRQRESRGGPDRGAGPARHGAGPREAGRGGTAQDRKARQQIAYEQDDYNRARLQQQLDQALESREEAWRAWLNTRSSVRRPCARRSSRSSRRADSQLEALDREQEAVEAAYAERMQEAALRAEAEKLILSQSQDELLSLLEQYAPEYDALGQTLGEKLLEGFARGAGDVAAWFEDFSARLTQAQADMAALAQSAADAFYDSRQTPQAAPAVTVNQTVEFNQPRRDPGAGRAADGGSQRSAGCHAVGGGGKAPPDGGRRKSSPLAIFSDGGAHVSPAPSARPGKRVRNVCAWGRKLPARPAEAGRYDFTWRAAALQTSDGWCGREARRWSVPGGTCRVSCGGRPRRNACARRARGRPAPMARGVHGTAPHPRRERAGAGRACRGGRGRTRRGRGSPAPMAGLSHDIPSQTRHAIPHHNAPHIS